MYSKIFRSKKDQEILVRNGTADDAPGILAVSKAVINEEIYQLTSSGEFNLTLEAERKWVSSFQGNPNKILLVALVDFEIAGILDFSSGHRQRIAHTGDFGMSVSRESRGNGVGGALLQALLDWAKQNGQLEKINLQVHATNLPAQALYKKFGFEVEGIRKRDLKYGPNEYVDSILMARFL